jgi:dihydroorotate dehydrogenase
MFPDDEELNYNKLKIQNGADACTLYSNLYLNTPEEIEEIRKALLDYCRLDTYALVKIYLKLLEVAG